MHNDEPDYSRYTLDQLYDACRHIDKDAFPERFGRLEREIALRESESTAPEPPAIPEKESPSVASRRVAAFVIDFMIVTILWSVIDSLLFTPVPESVVEITRLTLFLVYFVGFETYGRRASSPGKRAQGLAVRTPGGQRIMRGVVRAVIVAAIVWVDWRDVLSTQPLDRLPLVASMGARGLQIGSWLANLTLLVWIRPVGQLIQDRVTRTQVCLKGDSPSTVRIPVSALLLPLAASAVVGFVLVAAFSMTLVSLLGGNPMAHIKTPIRDLGEVNRSIRASIAEDTSIRTRVRVESKRVWSMNEETQQVLSVKVWIPALRWNESARSKVKESTLKILTAKPGAFDSGELVLWTGIGVLNIERTYPLNVP